MRALRWLLLPVAFVVACGCRKEPPAAETTQPARDPSGETLVVPFDRMPPKFQEDIAATISSGFADAVNQQLARFLKTCGIEHEAEMRLLEEINRPRIIPLPKGGCNISIHVVLPSEKETVGRTGQLKDDTTDGRLRYTRMTAKIDRPLAIVIVSPADARGKEGPANDARQYVLRYTNDKWSEAK